MEQCTIAVTEQCRVIQCSTECEMSTGRERNVYRPEVICLEVKYFQMWQTK